MCPAVLISLLYGEQDLPAATTTLGAARALAAVHEARQRCGLTVLGSMQHCASGTLLTCTDTAEALEVDLWLKLTSTWGGKRKKYPPHLNLLWGRQGLTKEHVFCFTHGAGPRFTCEYMRKWGSINSPFKERTTKIIAFWWSKGSLSWNSRYSSVTLLMKGTDSMSFGKLGSACSLALPSSQLAIYGISLISQQN